MNVLSFKYDFEYVVNQEIMSDMISLFVESAMEFLEVRGMKKK